MLLFEYILILLAAICLSNVVNRFLPVIISVPLIQIALGALITLLPLGFQLEFDPDLFFVLFVAPLIFRTSLLADKKTMWAQRKPILNASVFLLLATVVIMGYLVNFLIPFIPLAAAFALIAALGPTDDVAVISMGKRTNVPPKIMNILQGESIINDASGIVSFQFALAAMLTGTFSAVHATERFFVVALGGIAVGLLLSWLKYKLVHWIRSLGMENVTLHLMLDILTPFVIYLIAERLEVSGILAVFAAGIAHSLNRDKFNPEMANLNIATESVWSMLIFTIEGMVFVILGTQLPKIFASINQNAFSIGSWEIIIYILLITLLLLALRFIWAVAAIKEKNYDDPKHPVNRFRMGIIFSLSGARGAVTLASVMSIPFFLSSGEAFPQRSLIILIAGGVIVISLIITSFILPLFIEKRSSATDESAENEAYLEILQNVITELKNHITPENEAATAIITANYHRRRAALQRKQKNKSIDPKYERELRITSYEWEKENVAAMLARGETTEFIAQQYVDILNKRINRLSKNKVVFGKPGLRFLRRSRRVEGRKQQVLLRTKIMVLMEANAQFVLEKLKKMSRTNDNPAIRKVMADYELKLSMYQRRMRHSKLDNEILASVVSYSFQIERDNIQAMFEAGRISRETARDMRHNLSLLEVEVKKAYF